MVTDLDVLLVVGPLLGLGVPLLADDDGAALASGDLKK